MYVGRCQRGEFELPKSDIRREITAIHAVVVGVNAAIVRTSVGDRIGVALTRALNLVMEAVG